MIQIYNKYRSHFSQIAKLSFPIIIGQLGMVLMGMADVMMVGKLDATNLAAVGASNAVYFLVVILGIGTLTAISPLVAKAKGGGHAGDVKIYFKKGVIASLLLTAVISLVVFVLTINMHWFGQQPGVTELSIPYLHILNAGTVFMLWFYGVKQFSDGIGLTKPSAIITIIALLLNVLLNWVFIFGNWGFEPMGLNGAGYATSISKLFMAVAMTLFVLRNKIYIPYLTTKELPAFRAHLTEIFKIGLPSGFQYFFEVAAFAGAAIIIGWYGEYELAAHNIAINIASTTYMIATGISAAGSILVGDAIGRKNKTDIMLSGRAALIMGAVFMSLCALLFIGANSFIVGLYTTDVRVSEMAMNLLFIAALFQLSDGIQCVGVGILRGLSDTKIPTLITIIAYWVIGIPVGMLLGNKYDLSLYGIWFGLSIGLTFSAILLCIRFLKESKRTIF
jgi:multidrug resistance protein, MATE family